MFRRIRDTMKKIIDKVSDFSKKLDLFPRGGIVLAAVSGGKDSMVMLDILMQLRNSFGFELACAHFNHRLRAQESERDAGFVESYCQNNKISFFLGSGDVYALAAESGTGIEEAARNARYAFLQDTLIDISRENSRDVRIATAHTADDNAETFLLNLSRGSGLRGLCAIPPVRGKIIRPMLDVTTGEVVEYLRENDIPHVDDSTNLEDDYTRNRLRHHVIPALLDINPAFMENAGRAISILREDEDFLLSLARALVSENELEGELPAATLAELPKPVAARVIKLMADRELSQKHIDAILSIASGEDPHAAADIPGMRVQRNYDRLFFDLDDAQLFEPQVLKIGETLHIKNAQTRIISEFLPNCGEIHNSDNTFFFKNDSICGNIVVGARRDGDEIRLAGRGCTKTLKKLFNESRLNGVGMRKIPVLRDDRGVIAVSGFGLAERCLAKPGDDVICVSIQTDNPPLQYAD